jgi:bacterioferritin-associated ferredoxin
MIVCLCRAVSDRTIRTAAAVGLTLPEIGRATGAGSDCGRCADAVAHIVGEPGPCKAEPCIGCPRGALAAGLGRATA